jgi:hypothetical protein
MVPEAMRPEQPSTHPNRRFQAESTLVGAGVLLLLLPWLFVSSPDYREVMLLVFGIAAVCLAWLIPDLRAVVGGRIVRLAIACIIVAHAASLIGGLHHGGRVGTAVIGLVAGISGILGLGALTWVLLRPRWRSWAWRTFIALTVVLGVGSLLGFLVFNQWQEDLTRHTPHMDTRRLSLVWAPRLLSGELGRQFWAHANTAAFLFATAWVVLVDALFRRPKHAMAGWALALLLAVAIFLTASRSAWVMVILALPPLLAFRTWRYALKVGTLLALAGVLGIAAVNERTKPAAGGQTAQPADLLATIHLGELATRGSAGRLSAYQILWNDLAGHRIFGQGLAVTRKPVAHLLHEHSTYLATLRGGGVSALAAHLMLLGCTFRAAILLSRRGCRWPLLLAITVFSGLLFDRSTVFKLTGFDEFPVHWLAVWIPLAMWSHERAQPLTASCQSIQPDTDA